MATANKRQAIDVEGFHALVASGAVQNEVAFWEGEQAMFARENQPHDAGKRATDKALEGREDEETSVGPAGSPAGWARGCALARPGAGKQFL